MSDLQKQKKFRWYALHVASNSEKKAKQTLEEQIEKHNMSDSFNEIVIPLVKTIEVRGGKKVTMEKNIMLGYMLVNMNMNDDSWHLVQSNSKIYGFLGKEKPVPLSQKEVDKVMNQIQFEAEKAENMSIYNVNDKIQIIDGPFNSFVAVIDEVNEEQQKIKASVSIFDKSTSIELAFDQVRKVEE